MTFYHYTCGHGHEALGASGRVLPTAALVDARTQTLMREMGYPFARLAWFTDLDAPPSALALGLTSHYISCDRTAYRYRVTDDADVRAWLGSAERDEWRPYAIALESEAGVMPAHWYISSVPVSVVLA